MIKKLCKHYQPYNRHGGTSDSCQFYIIPICLKYAYARSCGQGHMFCPWNGYGKDMNDFDYLYEYFYLGLPDEVYKRFGEKK
jgi:hypothetical protein